MDWKSLKNKALDLSGKALEASTKALEQGKDYIEKAKEASEKAQEKGQEIKAKAEEMVDQGKSAIESAKEKGNETMEEAKAIKDRGASIVGKIKDFGAKAADTTSGVMSKAIPTIKAVSEYDSIKDNKYLALLFVKKDSEECKKLQIIMPVFIKDAWINGATFKVVDIEESPELAQKFGVTEVPILITYEKGEEKKRTADVQEIKKYLKDYTI